MFLSFKFTIVLKTGRLTTVFFFVDGRRFALKDSIYRQRIEALDDLLDKVSRGY